VTPLLRVTVLLPVISISGPCKYYLAGKGFGAHANLKQTVTSWLQTLDQISCTWGCKPHYHSGTNAWMLSVPALRSDVYNPLKACHVYIRDWIRFLMSENLLAHVLKILFISTLMLHFTSHVVYCLQKLSQTAPISAMHQMSLRHIQHQRKGEDDCKIWRFHFAEPLC